VDNERFQAMSDAARPARASRLASLGLDPGRPTVIFSGKLIAQKRPLDLVRAIERCGAELNLLLLGDGPLRADVRRHEGSLPVRSLGFINQAALPAWYASGDILALPSGREPWGLVVNEGMACGLIPWSAMPSAAGLISSVASGRSSLSATSTRWQPRSPGSRPTREAAGSGSATGWQASPSPRRRPATRWRRWRSAGPAG
jgi:glycosyltransferase involved in cell wall biosynthesis